MRVVSLLRTAALALGLIGASWAQSAPDAAAAAASAAAMAAGSAAAAAAPAPQAAPAAGLGGIQSANIFQIAPGAASDPNYANQNNGERARVQPGNNAPMWRAVGGGATGYSSLPKSQAPEAGNLIQPMVQYPGSRFTSAGEAWRQVRNHWLIPYGGALLLIAALALAILFVTKGALGRARNDGRPVIERFTPFERAAHWSNAVAFVSLAVSGIVMAFGKFFLLPVFGLHLFGWLTYLLKNIHNFAGPLFAVSLVIVLLTFMKDNIASIWDLLWLKNAGGMFGGEQVPSHRFNPAEKGMYWWGIFFPGLIAVASGLVLNKLIPGVGELRGQMQIAHMIHLVATTIMMAALFGHIYMGTVGVRGAYKAMRTGYVDEAWAKEHHLLWYNDIVAGKIPAKRSAEPVPVREPGHHGAAA